MSRILLIVLLLMATAGAIVTYGDPDQIARARDNISQIFGRSGSDVSAAPAPAVIHQRGGLACGKPGVAAAGGISSGTGASPGIAAGAAGCRRCRLLSRTPEA